MDLTCVEIVLFPRSDNDDTLVVESILVGERFKGYPGKFRWGDESTCVSRSTLSLTGYTWCRIASYLCLAGAGWQLLTHILNFVLRRT